MNDAAVLGEPALDLRHESPQVHEVLAALGRLLGGAVGATLPA